MSKRSLWTVFFVMWAVLIAVLIYSDWFGNKTIQDSVLELIKPAFGAFAGAWANEYAK